MLRRLRTANGREIDLVLKTGQELWAIETKLTTRPTRAAMARLNDNADLIGAHRRFLVTRQPEPFTSRRQTACDLAEMISIALNAG